jgi:predicted AAA+ superfamily ATPase
MVINKENIILIGPLGVGKSTLALKLSEKTGILNFPIDHLKWYYRFKNGYNLQLGTEILKAKGFDGLIKYASNYFSVNELREVLSGFNGILDLSATDTYCDNSMVLEQLFDLFNPFENIFLILPTNSLEQNMSILSKRLRKRYGTHEFKDLILDSYIGKNNQFLKSETNYVFAKHIIYTEGRDINEICDEIINKVRVKLEFSLMN